MRICFATNNEHKLKEAKQVMQFAGLEILSLQDMDCSEELPETQNTLEGNALQKAEYFYNKFNIPCFSDDTGLEVDALNGAPGVYSARYAGEHKSIDDNISLLLKNLRQVKNRSAQFRTIIALVGFENRPVFFEGKIRGSIIAKRSGSSGFGYDSVFIPNENTETFAEMTPGEKNIISHRAIAVKKLETYLKNLLRLDYR